MTQTGRPNDGTDATGFYNIEMFVKMHPENEWKTGRTKEQLVDDMNKRLSVYPGIDFNFSQPISDNVEEARVVSKAPLSLRFMARIFILVSALPMKSITR